MGPRVEIQRCPRVRGRRPVLYALGSSTMGGLAVILKRALKPWGVKVRSWAVASTGLARPDFHDWPAEVPGVARRYDPDAFVVCLGTNDNQAVRVGRKWVRPKDPRWEKIYAGRVDAMLRGMSLGRPRPIYWIGPNALDRRSSRTVGRRINELMRRRVEAFSGPAWFIDAYDQEVDPRGRVRERFVRPDGKRVRIKGRDNVHLNPSALRWLLAEPVLARLRPCWGGGPPGARPRRPAAREARRPRGGS